MCPHKNCYVHARIPTLTVQRKVLIPYQKLKIVRKNVVTMACRNKLYDNRRSTVRFFLDLRIMPLSFIRTLLYYTDKDGLEKIEANKKIGSPWTGRLMTCIIFLAVSLRLPCVDKFIEGRHPWLPKYTGPIGFGGARG